MEPTSRAAGLARADPEEVDSSAQMRRRVQARLAAPWGRARPWLYLAADLALAAFAWILLHEGYPTWRVGALGAVLASWVALQLLDVLGGRGPAVAAAAGWGMSATWFGAVAVTGGTGSPLVFAPFACAPLVLLQQGLGRAAWARLLALCAAGAAVAVLPEAWAGPGTSAHGYAAVASASVALALLVTVVYLALLTRVAHDSIREATRAREERLLQALARARELEQVGAQLSHELKNPLSAIKTLVQLSARAAREPAARERLEVVEGEIRRMQAILQDHLSFSRPLDKLRPEPVSLAALADEVLSLVSGRAEEAGVALSRHGDASALADPRRTQEALLNLVVNALEASPRGGRVEVELAERDGRARLTVRDGGRGMTPEVLARIGTPFFTTREQGTGLGVALARAAFVHQGGGLEYQSAPGAGTTATATLPAHGERRADGARAGGG